MDLVSVGKQTSCSVKMGTDGVVERDRVRRAKRASRAMEAIGVVLMKIGRCADVGILFSRLVREALRRYTPPHSPVAQGMSTQNFSAIGGERISGDAIRTQNGESVL